MIKYGIKKRGEYGLYLSRIYIKEKAETVENDLLYNGGELDGDRVTV